MSPRLRHASRAVALALFALSARGCAQPECVRADYRLAECRVLAENELARLRTAAGAELRFQAPSADDAESWDARGRLLEPTPGEVDARVSAPGDFALSLDARGDGLAESAPLSVVLDNVDPRAVVELVGSDGSTTDIPPAAAGGLKRQVTLDAGLGAGTSWIRGRGPCPERYRIAAVGDIQTGQQHMQRLMDTLAEEAVDAEASGEPVLALVVLGDLTELSRDDEFAALTEMFEGSPVPVAVTPGNHDILRDAIPLHTTTFGPGTFGFDVCRTRVVLLDTGSGSLAVSVQGRIHELLEREDREAVPFLIAGTHYPAYAGLTGDGWSREDQSQYLLAALESAGADALLAAHIHSLEHFSSIPVAGGTVRELIVGTGGADQGAGHQRHGYLRLTFADSMSMCFVEVPAPGSVEHPDDLPIERCDEP